MATTNGGPWAQPRSATPLPESTPSSAASAQPAAPLDFNGQPAELLGDVIVRRGFCDRPTVEAAIVNARACGRPFGRLLVDAGDLRADQLAMAIAVRYGLRYV